jgi:hypothetical protein
MLSATSSTHASFGGRLFSQAIGLLLKKQVRIFAHLAFSLPVHPLCDKTRDVKNSLNNGFEHIVTDCSELPQRFGFELHSLVYLH